MINLCNDVLNKDRRNMFPKIQTLNTKLSLYSLIFIRQQNPLKFYKSFYNKILKDTKKNLSKPYKKISKNNSILSLLSKSQNYFYSVPIRYNNCNNNYHSAKLIYKYNFKDKYHNDKNYNIMRMKKEKTLKNSLVYNTQNNIDILNNKNLKKVHEYLIKYKDNNKNINKKKKSKSCNDLYMENVDKDTDSNNSFINDKISRGQQTIYNKYNLIKNKKNEYNKKLDNIKEIELYKNKEKYNIDKKEKKKKFTITFIKNRDKVNNLKKNENNNKIKVIWRNLRRPINMNFNSSININEN